MLNRVLTSSIVIFAVNLYATPPAPCEPAAPAFCCEEPKPGPFAFTYPFDRDLNCPCDFYVHADALCMQAKEDGLDFAIEKTNPQSSLPLTNGKVAGFSNDNHDWDWNPGMRLGLGVYLDHDAWNLDFNWSWVNITNYKHANATTSLGQMNPLWALGIGTFQNNIGGRCSASWSADYNTFDMSLAKAYYVSRSLIFNPHFGLRGGWIDQHFGVDYGGNNNGPTRTIFHANNDFWGIGARTGLDIDWNLGKGLSLFGKVAASMLFGKFQINQNYQIGPKGFNIHHHLYQNVPNCEWALGISWGHYFDKKRCHIGLSLAYEFQEWFDQLQLRKFNSGSYSVTSVVAPVSTGIYDNDVVSRGNLTLNGLSFKLQLDI